MTVRHRDDPTRRAVIPVHGSKELAPKTLHSILKGARLTIEEFLELL